MDMTEVNKVTWNVFRQAQSQSKEKPISQHHHAQFLLLSNFVRSHDPQLRLQSTVSKFCSSQNEGERVLNFSLECLVVNFQVLNI